MRFLQGSISVACQSCYNIDSQLNSLGAHDCIEKLIEDTQMRLEHCFDFENFQKLPVFVKALDECMMKLGGLFDQRFDTGIAQLKSLQGACVQE